MSVAVSSWVWKNSKTTGNDRLLLLAIADTADDDGDNAWPSIETLADKATCSERTVQRRIQVLEETGCLTVTRGGGRHGTHRYRVHMDARAAKQPKPTAEGGDNLSPQPVDNQGGDRLSPGVTQLCRPGGDTQVSPERPERPTTPPSPPASRGATCTHGRSSCRQCRTNPRADSRRQQLAAAEAAAAEVARIARARAEVAWCGDRDCDPQTRWRTVYGLGRDSGETRCPTCHPDVVVGRPPVELLDLADSLPRLRHTG